MRSQSMPVRLWQVSLTSLLAVFFFLRFVHRDAVTGATGGTGVGLGGLGGLGGLLAKLANQQLSESDSTAGTASVAQAHFVGPPTGYPLARCVDGSPGLYYLSEGYGSGSSKFLLFHEGGGFCNSDADCLERSRSRYGSTVKDSLTMDLESLGDLKLSRSSAENPLMYNWNHVLIRYCDGGYFSGEATHPVKMNESYLYFRGKYITEAVFEDLAKFGLSTATDVVISGCSAGAIHVFAHLDALRALVHTTAKVVGLADSGFYMDLEIFTPLKRYVVIRQEATSLLNVGCATMHSDRLEKCLVGSVVAPFLRTPIFAFQSRFDLDQQSCEMDAACRASKGCIVDYAKNLTAALQQDFSHFSSDQRGFFLDSCPRHCSYGPRPLDDTSGLSQLQAFAAWYKGGSRSFGQRAVYRCDRCCHGRSWDILDSGTSPSLV